LDTLPFVYAVGDIAPDRPNADECFDLVRAELQAARFCFGQLETSFTALGARMPQARHAVRAAPEAAGAIARANFGLLSCAGNHCMDWGADALLDTIGTLEAAGVQVVGAGADIMQARRPVVREVAGRRIAFLAYCSILPQGYWAEQRRAGCAPMRAHTLYEQVEHDQPGTPARIHTYPHADDLAALEEDIRSARSQSDAVVVSLHWGIHFIPAVIAGYQRVVGRAAVEAGADVVLGHHAHILKGFEFHQGRPIFHSIGNFAVDLRMDKAHAESASFREIQKLHPRWIPDFDSLYNFPEDSRATLIVRLAVPPAGPLQVSVLPAWINRQAQPARVLPGAAEFRLVVDYVNEMAEVAGLNGRLREADAACELVQA